MSLDEFVAWWDLSQQGATAVLVSKDVISEKEPQCVIRVLDVCISLSRLLQARQ